MKQIGLSAMLERLVGLKLSKELQCSAWDVRPLTVDQVKYAAADASCLVELFLVGVAAFVASSGGVEGSHRVADAAVADNGEYVRRTTSRPSHRWIDAGEVDERVFRAFGRNSEWQ